MDDAIRYLLTVHTVPTFDGGLTVLAGGGPANSETAERLYREAWQMLKSAVTDRAKAPLGGIDAVWIDNAEDRIAMASSVTLDRDQFRALLAIRAHGLRPKAV